METSSYFIKNRALFGSYPTQEKVDELEKLGVRYFVDLTCDNESKIKKYKTNYTYIRYPIEDHKVPTDWISFSKFLVKICKIIRQLKHDNVNKEYELFFISCKGGHGRAGIVVACLLCILGGYSVEKSLELTNKYHSQREKMRELWRAVGSPQTNGQKRFVYKFFENLYFFRAYKSGFTMGFSNFCLYSVTTELGTFPTSEAAFQAYKDPENKEYIKMQIESKSPVYSKQLGMRCNLRKDWHDVRDLIMYKVVKLKFEQHEELRNNLMNTGFRNIIERNFYNNNNNFQSTNKLGIILMKLRKEFIQKEIILDTILQNVINKEE